MINWLATQGGPFVLGEPEYIAQWEGASRRSKSSGSDDLTDYQRACSVQKYLDLVPCGSGKVLVLGDEPMQTTLVSDSQGRPLVIRWHSCKKNLGSQVLDFVNEGEVLEIPIEFIVRGKKLLLMDSSQNFKIGHTNMLSLTLNNGVYGVTTERARRAGAYHFILHRFIEHTRSPHNEL